MKKKLAFLRRMMVALMWMVPCLTWAANSVTTVSQVTGTTDVTTAVDYTVTSATPFATAGIVNIQETEHAVLILAAVKPSAAIPLLASHVQIDGAKAVNGQNCQVKLYNRGCIILPYGDSVKPLTVYDGQNFTGTSVNSFGLENSNGFMNTLTAAKLNNKIRSFTPPRLASSKERSPTFRPTAPSRFGSRAEIKLRFPVRSGS